MAASIEHLSYDPQGNVVGVYRLRSQRISYGNVGGFLFENGVCGPVPGTRALRKLIAAMGHELELERLDAPAEAAPPPPAPPPPPRMKPSAVTTHDGRINDPARWSRAPVAPDADHARVQRELAAMDHDALVEQAERARVLIPEGTDDGRIRELLLDEWERRRQPNVEATPPPDEDPDTAEARAQLAVMERGELEEYATESEIAFSGETTDDQLRTILFDEWKRRRDVVAAAQAEMAAELEAAQAAQLAEAEEAEAERRAAEEAARLEAAAAAATTDLDALDKEGLKKLAAERGIEIDGRWGEARIREALLEALTAPTGE